MDFAFRKFVCGATAWLIFVTPVWGQNPSADARFDISGFSVLGAPQIAADEFSRIVAPFIGRQKNSADVQKAQQAVQRAYLDLGHCSTQVTVAQAQPESGVVTFRLAQTATPLVRDCAQTIVLDQKRAVPPVPVAPGEVATRPLADVTGAFADAVVPPEAKTEIARATTKPLQDGPVVKPLQDRPPVPTVIASAPVVAPKIEAVPPKPEVVAKAEPVLQPKPPVVAVAPKPEPAPVPKVEVAPPQPAVVAKVEPVPAPKPTVVAIAPKPEPVPAPKIEVAPVSAPEVVAKVEPAPEPKPPVVAIAPKPEPAPAPKIEAALVVPEVVAKVEPVPAPKPTVVAIAPKPEPVPAPKIDVAPVVPEVVAKVEPVPAPKPTVVAIAPKPEPAPKIEIAPAIPEVVAKAEPVLEPKPPAVALAPKPEQVPAPKLEPAPPPEVVVRPLADAGAQLRQPEIVPSVKPEIERAPVRPLQDRPQPSVETAGIPAPAASAPQVAAKPKPAVPETIAQATPVKPETKPGVTPERKAAAQPVPVYVQAPADASAATIAQGDEEAAAAALRFDIARYLVVGNTMLKPDEIRGVLRSYTGRQKDFADVQRALESLQTAYSEKGYSAVQVTLPEQELERGEVRFEVVETKIGKIEFQGNELHSERNVRNSLPSLREGFTPNSLDIARNLKLANENASKQTQVSLRAGSQDGEVDAMIKLIEDDPVKYSVSMDNTGTYSTGKYRTGFGYQNSNMFNRDHTLTLQYITSPEHPSAVTVFGFGYRVPLYASGNSIDLIAGFSDVSSGTVNQLFNVSGAGTVFGLRFNHNFDRVENYEHKIVYGLDYKAFQSNVTFIGSTTPLVPDVTIHPVSVTYSGLWRGATSQFDFYASYSQNVFPGGNDGANSDFQERKVGYPNPARTEAKAGYNIIRAGANYTHQMWGEWQARAALNIQQTDAALIAGEQFGAGGAESVRGFDERVISNDRGWRANFELYTPDIAGDLGWTGGRAKVLVFYDTADLTRNRRQPGEASGNTISSYGLGLRLQTKNVFSMKVDYAQVYHDSETDSGTPRLIKDGRRNSNTVHASMVWVF